MAKTKTSGVGGAKESKDQVKEMEVGEVGTGLGQQGKKLSLDTCIKVVGESLLMGRKALKMELAVCLSIFAGAGKVDAQVKEVVMGVYQKAGYKWETSGDAHYKTANRRMNASAALYEKLGQEELQKWIGEAQEEKLIHAVVAGLEQYEFSSMDEVLYFVGKDSNVGRKEKEQEQKGGEAAGAGGQEKEKETEHEPYRFAVGRVKVVLPWGTTADVMMKLAAKIIKEARKLEDQELAQTRGSKEVGREAGAVLH